MYNGVMVQPLIGGMGLVGMPAVNSNQASLQAPNFVNRGVEVENNEKSMLGPRARPEDSKDDDLEHTDTTEKVKKKIYFF